MRTKPKIAILGAGPSAAYAFRACRDCRIMPVVYAKQRIYPTDAFWLHWLPKSLSHSKRKQAKSIICIEPLGEAGNYAYKMWESCAIATSFPEIARKEPAFHPRRGLDLLWDGVVYTYPFERHIGDAHIHAIAQEFDLVFQTFPSEQSDYEHANGIVLFRIETKFVHNLYYSTGGVCLYNGMPDSAWTRCTAAFGRISIEYPPEEKLKFLLSNQYTSRTHSLEIARDIRPEIVPDYETIASNIVLTGRFACWDRTQLAHSSYDTVVAKLRELGVD